MKIEKDFKNTLLRRREIQFFIESKDNPGFENSRKIVVEKLKVPEDNVAIKSVRNNFGTHDFFVEAFVYDTKEEKERIEPKFKEKSAKEEKK